MHPFLDYILKANLLLIFFGLFYLIFLKRETFYQLNRWFFVGSIIVSITAPFITFTKTVLVDPIPVEFYVNDSENVIINEVVKEPSFLETIDLQQSAVFVLLFISSVLIFRKMYAVAKLYRSIKKLPNLGDSNIKINTNTETVYSFYKWIVVPENFFQWQNHQLILDHESIHLNQKHTFDLILVEMVAAVFWFNPLIKILQRHINSNLEFIVDAQMVQKTEPVLYQKNLLLFQAQKTIQFANSYSASEIKSRILQLNSKKSTNMKKLKFLLATPALIAFFAFFQVETVAQIKETIEVQEMEETSFLVRENFTKDDFAKLSKKLKDDFGIDFSVSNLKYDNNKIKSLDYTIRNKDLKISTSETATDKNIEPFLIIVNLNGNEPFRVEKYSAKPTYAYTVDNEVEPNFVITDDEWKDHSWVNKISKNQRVIYVIDGTKSSKGAALTLNPKDILSINVHRDQKTKDNFNKAVDNVVIIRTKKVKDVTNRDKDLELLLSDRKAFDRIAAKYPIYVDGVLLTKKQLNNFDTKTITSMYVDENVTEVKLTTKKSETETFFFKIEDDNDQSANNKTHSSIFINGKESTEEELKNHINKINQQKKDSISSSNKTQVQKINHKDIHVTLKGFGSAPNDKIVYIVDGKEINSADFRKIHPGDIERIDVLKDQQAKDNYKGKDGVIVVTTKAKKEVSLQQKTQALKAKESAMIKRNEAIAERKEMVKKRKIEIEKLKQEKKNLKTVTSIFNNLNKSVKELEDENVKITSVKASITREDGTKIELSETY